MVSVWSEFKFKSLHPLDKSISGKEECDLAIFFKILKVLELLFFAQVACQNIYKINPIWAQKWPAAVKPFLKICISIHHTIIGITFLKMCAQAFWFVHHNISVVFFYCSNLRPLYCVLCWILPILLKKNIKI